MEERLRNCPFCGKPAQKEDDKNISLCCIDGDWYLNLKSWQNAWWHKQVEELRSERDANKSEAQEHWNNLSRLSSEIERMKIERDESRAECERLKDQIHEARLLWCDSKRDPETGAVHIKFLDQFEAALRPTEKGTI